MDSEDWNTYVDLIADARVFGVIGFGGKAGSCRLWWKVRVRLFGMYEYEMVAPPMQTEWSIASTYFLHAS